MNSDAYPGLDGTLTEGLGISDREAALAALRFTLLFHDSGKPSTAVLVDHYGYTFHGHEKAGAAIAAAACDRFHVDSGFRELVTAGVARHMGIPKTGTDASVRRWIRKMGDLSGFLLDLYRADRASLGAEATNFAEETMERVRCLAAAVPVAKKFPVTGHDVMTVLGLTPGRQVGEVLAYLENLVDENLALTRDGS